jgi:hypothetical protein
MDETICGEKRQMPLSREEACSRVAKLYHSGNNCDKAVFLVLQDLEFLPKEHWDFTDLYTDKPDSEHFICKVFAAGIISIYLNIITRRYRELGMNNSKILEPIERVNDLMNALLRETSDGKPAKLNDYDPFKDDIYLKNGFVTEKMREEYRQRALKLAGDFQQEFKCSDCVDVLGFDPLSYELYDEAIQEKIEEGEWMEKCVDCMKHIIQAFYRER